MNKLLAEVISVLILAVTVLDIAALIATPFISRRVNDETEHILVGLLPLEMMILLLSPTFCGVALLVLSGI